MNRILIIDDDKELCALIKRSILREEIETDYCLSGKDGLKKLEENDYHLVILDVMMPGMDGFETLAQIRAESNLPILMFTSKNDSISKVRELVAAFVQNGLDVSEAHMCEESLEDYFKRVTGGEGIA